MSDQGTYLTSFTNSPQPPAERGAQSPTNTTTRSGPQPHPDILKFLGDQPLASKDTRACKAHRARQKSNCIDCWTFRPITFADIPWCGKCEEGSRTVQIDPDDYRAGLTWCPTCHPKGIAPAELEQVTARHTGAYTGQGKDFAIPRGDR